jgi:hypothetical protein
LSFVTVKSDFAAWARAMNRRTCVAFIGGLVVGRRSSVVGRRRQRQRRHRELVLAVQVQHGPAGDQHLQPRRRCQQLGDQRCRVEDLLEVVQQQQRPLRPQEGV